MSKLTCRAVVYECDLCGCYHPWHFIGDCRNDATRLYDDDLLMHTAIRTWEERVEADGKA